MLILRWSMRLMVILFRLWSVVLRMVLIVRMFRRSSLGLHFLPSGSRQLPPAFATTVTLPPQPPIVPVMQKNDQPKPPVFSGQNFKRWREQVMFYGSR
ncbi:hypothetical protein LIER_40650 [Lithospermum erythrorhizon]|uniref:Uncharacterized protein n=1 Tax=Lithospermum erythrorhizon TaxID=34254 RepID=A0AAV3QXT9_LITER